MSYDPPRNLRELFMPKMRSLKEQCVSCPFRDDNDEEFGVIVQRLRDLHDAEISNSTPLSLLVVRARERIRHDTETIGDFRCHCTVYDEDMTVKPMTEHRQCPGATKHFVDAGVELTERYRARHG